MYNSIVLRGLHVVRLVARGHHTTDATPRTCEVPRGPPRGVAGLRQLVEDGFLTPSQGESGGAGGEIYDDAKRRVLHASPRQLQVHSCGEVGWLVSEGASDSSLVFAVVCRLFEDASRRE